MKQYLIGHNLLSGFIYLRIQGACLKQVGSIFNPTKRQENNIIYVFTLTAYQQRFLRAESTKLRSWVLTITQQQIGLRG